MNQQYYIIEETIDNVIEDYYSTNSCVGLCTSIEEGKLICQQLEEENKIFEEVVELYNEKLRKWRDANPPQYPSRPIREKIECLVAPLNHVPEYVAEREKKIKERRAKEKEYNAAYEAESHKYKDLIEHQSEKFKNECLAELKDKLPERVIIRFVNCATNLCGYSLSYHASKDISYSVNPIAMLKSIK